ncbi:MAG: carboxy-S-adenosyl-L-methionine synthase CmoA [Candidatus Thiodiazotropha sp. (ex Ctena orbiculata)]|nr:carboxy-S-adenosyl-L-methionine synthase CmoA [Candidatus Thiodiazotropha taylori]PUB81596.1 MAG: carboxy-S-adenosyl-L-methionine synthase CmoA [gamma proteobacterium symbiont of Ctena orbiculata]MBT2998629.1 carboxy-S-adenosyl-L-methionine synthase CmoA [Candidatus Thiodiazotropha taylori]MBT3001455.1 carboxy-S-adenosyl-L-methionine synthase CmoA [Candidatus Thiodiazotropha taylori]MBV2106107.1 carboxy-S-adenosyl-L-methionine synthase CmoA [Candidatus Thiodiazotropha taylori]
MSEDTNKDRLYAEAQDSVSDFVFDERVAGVFPDMINRSVPGYGTIINMIGTLAAQHIQAGTYCYDLGCSLGAAMMAIHASIDTKDVQLVGVDKSPAMVARAKAKLAECCQDPPVELICADIRDLRIQRASMVVLNFTLQFVPAEERVSVLKMIHHGMLSGGLLVLSEKIALPDEASQQLFTEMHHGFKKAQGYSDLEISQKRSALEDVLIPETLRCHIERLKAVGFSRVEVWFQCFNFVSLLAIK